MTIMAFQFLAKIYSLSRNYCPININLYEFYWNLIKFYIPINANVIKFSNYCFSFGKKLEK